MLLTDFRWIANQLLVDSNFIWFLEYVVVVVKTYTHVASASNRCRMVAPSWIVDRKITQLKGKVTIEDLRRIHKQKEIHVFSYGGSSRKMYTQGEFLVFFQVEWQKILLKRLAVRGSQHSSGDRAEVKKGTWKYQKSCFNNRPGLKEDFFGLPTWKKISALRETVFKLFQDQALYFFTPLQTEVHHHFFRKLSHKKIFIPILNISWENQIWEL